MKLIDLPVVAFAFILASCNGQSINNTSPMLKTDAGNKQQTTPPTYTIHGLLDPGINNLVAYAFKAPYNWHCHQSFTRQWNGATPLNMIYIQLSSPDGANSIEFLPATAYFFNDGPTARSLRQTSAQMGLAPQHTPGEMSPMPAIDYLKRVCLPQLAQHGLSVRINNEKVLPYQQKGNNTTESKAYADGILQDGKKVRVECIVSTVTTHLNGDVFYNWTAAPIIIKGPDIESNYQHAQHLMSSIAMNPEWVKRNNELVHKGNAVNSYYNQKDANAVRDFRNYQNDLRQRTFEERSDMARRHAEAGGDLLSGKQKYEDATGRRATLDAGYNHVYKDRQDNHILYTDKPLDAGLVDWEELRVVETTRY